MVRSAKYAFALHQLSHPAAFVLKLRYFEPLGLQIRVMPGFFVLVLSVSGTCTRTRKHRIEYEYHFIEHEYERMPTERNFKKR